MNKKAILALCLAVILPLVSYFIVRSFSEEIAVMPPKYFYDTVVNKVVDGKLQTDTLWHQVDNITLTNQLNEEVSLYDIQGKVIVANFFFTRCPSICPRMTSNMKLLEASMKQRDRRKLVDTAYVHFLSFSVDPERDSVEVLKNYADRYGVNPDVWWLLTGEKQKIYDFALEELKLATVDGEGVDENFIHSERFVLLDKNKVVRGFYNGLDSVSLAKLAEDIIYLKLEKDPNVKRNPFKPKPL